MSAKNRTCYLCKTAYHFCPSCRENVANPKPSWYTMFHSEKCKDTFMVLSDYFLKKVSKQEARNLLSKYDYSDISTYNESTQKQIQEIFAVEPEVEKAETLEEMVVEEKLNIETDVEQTSKPEVKTSRKRKQTM